MKYNLITLPELGVTAETTTFAPEGGVIEWHVMLHVEPRGDLFAGQLQRIYAAEDLLPSILSPTASKPTASLSPTTNEPPVLGDSFAEPQYVLKRYFLSDATNQQPLIRPEPSAAAVSLIQQQPLDGSKIAVWLYLQAGTEVTNDGQQTIVSHNGYRHLWKMGMTSNEGDSAAQTERVLTDYEQLLASQQATLADNCIRTWFFVRDVDTQYMGMVKARRDNFRKQGLTEQTHYIASTGIGGLPADPHAIIQMGCYALTGFQPEQQCYLYAKTHLNPTYEYGVTFERGVAVEFGDREHVYISGTASIDNKGQVLHVGDIVKQTHRMWENVETLLAEADCTFDDVMQIIVYLRDTADYELVRQLFDERFPAMPVVITLAPVCRPTWLIEMECVAVKERKNADYKSF